MRGWMVAGTAVVVAALAACADSEPADLIRAEWPAYSGAYEVREFVDGVPRVHRETIEFSDADHWRTEGDHPAGIRSQVGGRYCESHGDVLCGARTSRTRWHQASGSSSVGRAASRAM